MKSKFCILICLILGSCAVVDSSNFEYLDSKNLELHPILIIGAEQNVEISLPKSLATEISATQFIEHSKLKLSYTKVFDFPYEWLWGGPVHKDKGLYLFDLGFTYHPDRKLISEDVQTRAQTIKKRYEDFEKGSWRDYVLSNVVAEGYESKQGYQWVMENLPTVKQYHEVFNLPITNERQLVVWFWYNEDWVKDHPEWFKRRKALSRRILDTVKLSEPK
jgi:hypothetical protein